MKLPRFLRHLAAAVKLFNAREGGGSLYDYANGRWNLLAQWDDEASAIDSLKLSEEMITNARDNIYIAVAKCEGVGRGYLIVHDSNRNYYTRYFLTGLYEPEEAFEDVKNRCRMTADQMGFRRLTEQELGAS